MNFMTSLLIAALPVASLAQSQSGAASGVPSVAIPKTSEVMVIQTPRQGVTPQQIMAVMPSEVRATVKLYLDGPDQNAAPWTAAEVYEAFSRFRKANPEPRGELEHLNPFTLLVAVVLGRVTMRRRH